MNQSQKQREQLLQQARMLYSDKRTLPAVHPRYQHIYDDLYKVDEQKTGTFGIRLFICLLVFVCFIVMKDGNYNLLETGSQQIKEVISENLEILYETEIFSNDFASSLKSYIDSL